MQYNQTQGQPNGNYNANFGNNDYQYQHQQTQAQYVQQQYGQQQMGQGQMTQNQVPQPGSSTHGYPQQYQPVNLHQQQQPYPVAHPAQQQQNYGPLQQYHVQSQFVHQSNQQLPNQPQNSVPNYQGFNPNGYSNPQHPVVNVGHPLVTGSPNLQQQPMMSHGTYPPQAMQQHVYKYQPQTNQHTYISQGYQPLHQPIEACQQNTFGKEKSQMLNGMAQPVVIAQGTTYPETRQPISVQVFTQHNDPAKQVHADQGLLHQTGARQNNSRVLGQQILTEHQLAYASQVNMNQNSSYTILPQQVMGPTQGGGMMQPQGVYGQQTGRPQQLVEINGTIFQPIGQVYQQQQVINNNQMQQQQPQQQPQHQPQGPQGLVQPQDVDLTNVQKPLPQGERQNYVNYGLR